MEASTKRERITGDNPILAKLREDIFGDIDARTMDTFIEPDAYPRADSDRNRTPLVPVMLEQLGNSNNFIRSWLIQGDSGFGKTTLSYYLCWRLWEGYQEGERLPIYIHLPQIENLQNILMSYLSSRNYGKLEQRWIMNQPLILFLDGYDELHISERKNLYDSNGWSRLDVKIMLCCRPAALQHKNVSSMVGVLQANGTRHFETFLLAPFGPEQLERYVDKFIDHPPEKVRDSEYWAEPPWRRRETYLDWFRRLPGLRELIETPFLLSLTMQTLPRLVATQPHQAWHITRAHLYEAFIDDWLGYQVNRIAKPQTSKEIVGLEGDLRDYLWVYSQNLAAGLLKEGQINEKNLTGKETLKVELLEPNSLESNDNIIALLKDYERSDKAYFAGTVEYDALNMKSDVENLTRQTQLSARRIARIREGCLLHTQGDEFRFMHKSIAEFLAARSLFSGLRGEYEVLLSTAAGERWHLGINQQNLREESEILARLEEMAKQDSSIQGLLSDLIIKSREVAGLGIAAANAITLLTRLGTNFSGKDLSEVQISGADLRGGKFHGTNFTGANLEGVWFHGAWLQEARLTGANVTNINFGESAPLMHPDSVYALCHFQPVVMEDHEPQGYWLSGCKDGKVYQWSVHSEKMIATFNHSSGYFRSYSVNCVSVDNQRGQMASGGDDQCIRIWNLNTKKCLHILRGHTDSIKSIAFHPRGNQLASGSIDKTIRLLSVENGEFLREFKGHTKGVTSVAFHPTNFEHLASGSQDSTVRVWSVLSGDCLRLFEGHSYYVNNIAYHPNGEHIASVGDNTVRLWSVETGECLRELKGHMNALYSVAYHPSGDQLATGIDDALNVWEVEKGKCLHMFRRHLCTVNTVAYHRSGKQLASGSNDRSVRLLAVENEAYRRVLPGHSKWINSIAYHPNGKHLISGSWDGSIRIWSADREKCLRVHEGHRDKVCSVHYHPSGKYFASGSNDRAVRVWSVERGECLHELEGHTDSVTCIAFHPRGEHLASGSDDGTVRLWSIELSECLHVIKEYFCSVRCLAYHPSGEQLALGSTDTRVRVWSIEQHVCLNMFEGHDGTVLSVAYHPNGKQLASGSDDGTVRLWSVERDECMVLKGHGDFVSSVAYHPSGEQLISGSHDNTVRVWAVTTGDCLYDLCVGRHVLSCAFDPMGTTLAVGDEEGLSQFDYQVQNAINQNSKSKLSIQLLWNTIAISNFCRMDINQIIGCSHAIERLLLHNNNLNAIERHLSQNNNSGKPAVNGTLYQSWYTLFKPIPGTASCRQQHTIVKTNKQLTITEDRWVVSVARQLRNANSSGLFGSLFHTVAQHAFLVLEGIMQQRRFIIRAELTSPNGQNVIISISARDDIDRFRDSAKTYEAQQWDIPANIGRKLLRNIRADQRKTLSYSQTGGTGGVTQTDDYFNCVSWCIKQLRELDDSEIKIEDHWYNIFIVLPQDATRENEHIF